ncbi:MAG: ATP-binding cassette domain-containing protein [Kiritimatiellae bacterium]|nr:ATP-binding cassette domain-containing protein [Kiritimatiellia bacterium]
MTEATRQNGGQAHIRVENLELRYGDFVVQKNLTFTVKRGDVFVIMGGSGCGKSTLMKHMIGLQRPSAGHVYYDDVSFWEAGDAVRQSVLRKIGILYQQGALWSSLTLAENIAVPLEEFTDLPAAAIREMASFKLALVGLSGFEDYYPSEISGGMRKRAGLARAMALDPEILFFDEPSSGLDPISAKMLDDLILELTRSLGTTVVLVTHELASIFAIGNAAVFLDAESATMLAQGDPRWLRDHAPDPRVRRFLTRGADAPSPRPNDGKVAI